MSQESLLLPAALIGQITQVLAITAQHHAMASAELADQPHLRRPHDDIYRASMVLIGNIREALASPRTDKPEDEAMPAAAPLPAPPAPFLDRATP